MYGWAQAKESLIGQLGYSRTDLIKKEKRAGVWTFIKMNAEEIRVKKDVPSDIEETESIGYWGRTTEFPSLNINLKEGLLKPVEEFVHGEKGIGHIDVLDSKTGKVLHRWPMFYEVTQLGPINRAIFKAFTHDGGQYVVTRHYVTNQMFAPLLERRQTMDIRGNVLSDVLDSRNK